MNRRVRLHSTRTLRFSKYLKPGALAQIRDSRINARSQVLTHRVYSVVLSGSSVTTQESFPSAQIEFLPEFPSLERGPQCFGRKKLVAAKNVHVLEPNDSLSSLMANK